jgi:hypothetical protein
MIRIGPAGWKYKDWEGVVYPKPRPKGFDELEYISRYFNTVEANLLAAPEPSRGWLIVAGLATLLCCRKPGARRSISSSNSAQGELSIPKES